MRRYLPIALLAAAALGLSTLAISLMPHRVGAIWKGFRIVLVDSNVSEASVLEGMRASGFNEVLSESNQPLQISNYQSLVTDSLGYVEARMTDADPRRDEYIAGLGKWFHTDIDGKDYRIFYVRTGLGSALKDRVSKAVSRVAATAILPENGSDEKLTWLTKLAIVLVMAGLCLMTGKKREGCYSFIVLLPWLAMSLNGRAAGLGAGLISPALVFAVYQSSAALDEFNSSSGFSATLRVFMRTEASSLLLFGPAIGFMCLNPDMIFPCLVCLLASIILHLAAARLEVRLARGRKVFIPVPIGRLALGLNSQPKRSKKLFVAILCVLVLVLAIGLGYSLFPRRALVSEGASPIRIPQPIGEKSPQKPSPIDALRLRSSGRSEELVNMADWLVHRWFQEALFYLPLKSPPIPVFSSVSVPLPSQKSAILRVYDAAWARESYKDRPKGGIEGLLLSEVSFVRCIKKPIDMVESRPLAPIEVILYIILLAPASAGALSRNKTGTRNRREQRQSE